MNDKSEKTMDGQKQTNLKKLRKEAGISAHTLAERAGIALARIQHYESRYRDINKAEAIVVFRLAIELGCDVSDILELPEELVAYQKKKQRKRRMKKEKEAQ